MDIKPIHELLDDYPHMAKIRLMRAMGYIWNQGNCTCGTRFRSMNNKEDIALMEKNGWSPAGKGPMYHYQFSQNRIRITYWCHNCEEEKKYILTWYNPEVWEKVYELIMRTNPEVINEVFVFGTRKQKEAEELARRNYT